MGGSTVLRRPEVRVMSALILVISGNVMIKYNLRSFT